MSSYDVKDNQDLDYREIEKTATLFYEVLTEYLILKDKYEEPVDAKKLRIQAEKSLKADDRNYDVAFLFISTALKFLKAYNNLS